ncbi:hypothetical protein E4U52_006552 [Claviceps spartinae]|nr:hypothetical protein E4U52_006552 [Claviceps spartinae]
MGWVVNASPEVDAQSQWATVLIVCLVLSVLSIVTVGSRLCIRAKARGLAADDYMAALSAVFAFTYSVLCITQTKYGLGLPIKLRPAQNVGPYARVNFAGRPIYQIGISFFKIALLISYLRLLQGTDHRSYRLVVWGTIAVVFLAHLGCALSLIFACSPVEKSWKPWVPGTCLKPGPSFTGYAVVTIVSDVVVAVLPIPVLLKLSVRLGKKVGLIGIFMLGLFTTLCSILRYVQIDRIQNGDGNSTMLVLWGTIEFNIGNMVSSLPFLAPVFLKKARDYKSKYSAAYGSGSKNRQKRSRSLALRNGEHYKLSEFSSDKSAFRSVDTSEIRDAMLENGAAILKSVTYSVRVDDGNDAKSRGIDGPGRPAS